MASAYFNSIFGDGSDGNIVTSQLLGTQDSDLLNVSGGAGGAGSVKTGAGEDGVGGDGGNAGTAMIITIAPNEDYSLITHNAARTNVGSAGALTVGGAGAVGLYAL